MEPRALTTLGLEESADELKKAGRKAEADAMKDPYEFASAMRWEFCRSLCKKIWAYRLAHSLALIAQKTLPKFFCTKNSTHHSKL